MGTSTTDTKLRSVFLVVTVLLPVLSGAAVLPGSAAAGNSSIDAAGNQYDATLDSGDSYWQGQRVALQASEPGDDAGRTYGVVGANGSVRAIGLDGDAEYVLDTSDLSGEYAVTNESGAALNFTDGIASADPPVPSASDAANFTVEAQTLDVNFSAGEYAVGDLAAAGVASNRGDFVVNVSADRLNATQLAAVFARTDRNGDRLNSGPFDGIRGAGGERFAGDDSVVVYPDADTVAVYVERGGQIRANVSGYAVPTGNHTFTFDVQDTTAVATETVEVRADEDSDDAGAVPGVGNRSDLTVDQVGLAVNSTDTGHRSLDSLPSDGTATVVVGTNNGSTSADIPVPNRTVEVTVERPDGTQDSVTVTTAANGSARFAYDLAGKPDGIYRLDAASYPSTFTEFAVGNVTRFVPDGQRLVVDRETNFTMQVAENGRPVDAERTVLIEYRDGASWTTAERVDVRTGADGLATIPFTPQHNARYRVVTEAGDSVFNGIYAEAGTARARLLLHDRYRTDLPQEGRLGIAATVMGSDGPLANESLTVSVMNQSDFSVETNLTVRTNENGQFATAWRAPDAPLGTEYRIRISGAEVGNVATEYNQIEIADDVPQSDAGGGSGSGSDSAEPSVSVVDTTQETRVPGETVTYDVRVRDADGAAVADKRVFYSLELGYDGPTVATGTVRTDADGNANVTTAIPDWVPYGPELRLEAVSSVGGTPVSDSEYDQQLVRYELDGTFAGSDGERWSAIEPGERFTYNLTVRDAATGDPVSDLPVGAVVEARGLGIGMTSIVAENVMTDDRGRATFAGRVPSGGVESIEVHTVSVPNSRGDYPFVNYDSVGNYTTDLEGHDFYRTVDAGSTVSFNVTTDGTALPVTAVVTVGTDDDSDTNETLLGEDTLLYAGVVEQGEEISFEVPTNVEDGQRYEVLAMTSTPVGPQSQRSFSHVDRQFTVASDQISDTSPPVANATLPDRISVNNTFVVDASGSDDDTGIDTYAVTTEAGASVNGTESVLTVPGFDSTGTYDVTVTVTDAFGKTDNVTKQVEVVRAADVVGDVSVADEQAYRTNQTATVDVSNDGSRVVDGAVAVNVTTDRTGVPAFTETFDVNGLGVGESVNRTIDFTSWVRANNVTGDVTVSLGAVSPDDVTEATVANNNDTATTTVTYADLNTSVYVSGGAYENSTATVYAFVRNRGTAASAPVDGTFAVGSNETALTVPSLEPGEVYRTSVERTLTDDTNVSLAVSGEELFPAGNVTERALAVKPFDLTMNHVSGEREVEAGQEFYLSANFEATSESDVTVDIDLPDGLSLVRGSAVRTEHAFQGNNWHSWRVRADEHREQPYEVNVTVSANGANATGSDTVTVTVPTTRVRNATQSVLSGGESDTAAMEVADAETIDQSLTIDVQAGNAGRSLKGLDYLVGYPYGCVEQTASPMLSALYVDQYYRNASVSYDEATVDGSVLAGVDRLAPGGVDAENAQHDTGAWSMWGDTPSGDMFYTAYAAFGTASVANDPIQGDRAAVERNVSRIDYSAAVDWLRAEQAADGSFRHQHYFGDREAITGFILVGLRKADRIGLNDSASQDLSAIRADAADYLLGEQRSDGSWGSAQSTALAVWGLQTALESDADLNETRVRAAIDDGRSWLVDAQQSDGAWEQYHNGYAWDNTGDRSESTAYALLALNATGVSNDNATVTSGVSYLAGVYEEDGSWGYTRATALAIRALTVTGGDTAVSQTVTVTVGGDSMADPITKQIDVTPSDPIEQVELTDAELERLRAATDGSTRTVAVSTEPGDGRVYVEVLNDQIVNAAQYDG